MSAPTGKSAARGPRLLPTATLRRQARRPNAPRMPPRRSAPARPTRVQQTTTLRQSEKVAIISNINPACTPCTTPGTTGCRMLDAIALEYGWYRHLTRPRFRWVSLTSDSKSPTLIYTTHTDATRPEISRAAMQSRGNMSAMKAWTSGLFKTEWPTSAVAKPLLSNRHNAISIHASETPDAVLGEVWMDYHVQLGGAAPARYPERRLRVPSTTGGTGPETLDLPPGVHTISFVSDDAGGADEGWFHSFMQGVGHAVDPIYIGRAAGNVFNVVMRVAEEATIQVPAITHRAADPRFLFELGPLLVNRNMNFVDLPQDVRSPRPPPDMQITSGQDPCTAFSGTSILFSHNPTYKFTGVIVVSPGAGPYKAAVSDFPPIGLIDSPKRAAGTDVIVHHGPSLLRFSLESDAGAALLRAMAACPSPHLEHLDMNAWQYTFGPLLPHLNSLVMPPGSATAHLPAVVASVGPTPVTDSLCPVSNTRAGWSTRFGVRYHCKGNLNHGIHYMGTSEPEGQPHRSRSSSIYFQAFKTDVMSPLPQDDGTFQIFYPAVRPQEWWRGKYVVMRVVSSGHVQLHPDNCDMGEFTKNSFTYNWGAAYKYFPDNADLSVDYHPFYINRIVGVEPPSCLVDIIAVDTLEDARSSVAWVFGDATHSDFTVNLVKPDGATTTICKSITYYPGRDHFSPLSLEDVPPTTPSAARVPYVTTNQLRVVPGLHPSNRGPVDSMCDDARENHRHGYVYRGSIKPVELPGVTTDEKSSNAGLWAIDLDLGLVGPLATPKNFYCVEVLADGDEWACPIKTLFGEHDRPASLTPGPIACLRTYIPVADYAGLMRLGLQTSDSQLHHNLRGFYTLARAVVFLHTCVTEEAALRWTFSPVIDTSSLTSNQLHLLKDACRHRGASHVITARNHWDFTINPEFHDHPGELVEFDSNLQILVVPYQLAATQAGRFIGTAAGYRVRTNDRTPERGSADYKAMLGPNTSPEYDSETRTVVI